MEVAINMFLNSHVAPPNNTKDIDLLSNLLSP
jgi:hypothetical protein